MNQFVMTYLKSLKKVIAPLVLLALFSACQSDTKDSDTSAAANPKDISGLKLFELQSPADCKVNFVNQISENNQVNFYNFDAMYQGAGVCVGDINNDGLPDIYFAGNQVENKLYLNKGNMEFEDISAKAGVNDASGWTTGVSMADVNGDGFLDIYVCRFLYNEKDRLRNLLYVNQGDGTFVEQAEQFGIADAGYSIQASFFDYDKDGDLDLYVANQPANQTQIRKQLGKKRHYQFTDRLYKNNGNSTFTEVTEAAGIKNYSFSLSTSVSDVNGDGWPDIYVACDYEEPDFFYRNNRDGTFTNIAHTALRHMSNFSMGVDIADFNNDGLMDIYSPDMVAADNVRLKTNMSGMNPKKFWGLVKSGYHYQYMFNALQLNNGNGMFREIAQMSGVSNTDWSWSALFADFDQDGYKDLMVSNGLMRDMRNNDFRIQVKQKMAELKQQQAAGSKVTGLNPLELINLAPSHKISNFLFKNNGDLTFENKASDWGFDKKGWSQGAAYADLDNDGDLDIVLNNMNETASIYKNKVNENGGNNYLKLKLKGSKTNPFSYGAVAKLDFSDGTMQVAEIYPVRGFLSASDPNLHFGLGNNTTIEKVTITWSDNKQLVLSNVKANQVLEVNHASATITKPADTPKAKYFTDVTKSSALQFMHQENDFDDYKREILLPYKLSTLGPKLATADVNGDQLADVFVAGAAGQSGALFLQATAGQFKAATSMPWKDHAGSEDTNAHFFDADGDGDQDLYVTSGGNDFAAGSPKYQDRLYINNGKGVFTKGQLPKMLSSTGVASSSDVDGDGDLDLFVGGRQVPGQYGKTPESYLLINEGGKFKNATSTLSPDLANIGMVTDAVWMDYDKDGKDDLIVAGEWMPITVFSYNGSVLEKQNNVAGLENSSGWWNSLDVADLDKDGDLDLIAGNLGLNIKYKASKDQPFKLFAKDFDGNGSNDVYLGYYDTDGVCYPVRGRECSSQQMPFIKDEFKNYSSFANASIEQVLGKRKEGSAYREAQIFESVTLVNNGGSFEIKTLPMDAQIAPINGIVHLDVNKDGHLDLVVAGNNYHREIETTRSDAGTGTILLGDGKGDFSAVPVSETGLGAYGDVRDLALVESASGAFVFVANNSDNVQVFRLR